jgi:hypothetical protein
MVRRPTRPSPLFPAILIAAAIPRIARAEEPPAPPAPPAPSPPAPPPAPSPPAPPPAPAPTSVETPVGKFSIGGYVEANYSYNFNRPENGVTNYRGFDNRHNSFTLSNAVLDGQWEKSIVSGRVTLQVGHTPNTYYLAEPSSPGAAGAGSADASTWKYIQQAYVAAKAPVLKGLTFQLGIHLSPIGIEGMAIKDNWSWSRSNLFFGLPYYHTGLRATQQLTDKLSVAIEACNGWNSVVDNNPGKSITIQFLYGDPERLNFSVLYFGGPERPTGAPEGQPWRHLFDGWVQVRPVDRLWLAAQANSGFERNVFGTSWWAAGALSAQVRVASFLYLAARGDYFRERAASNANGAAANIFWPGEWVAEGTGTVDVRPHDNISIRLEYRHDQADVNTYFAGKVRGDGSGKDPFVPNAKSQDTLTLGATAWF